MCLYPTLRRNKRYVANAKNGGLVPSVYDTRVLAVPTKCGKCYECRKQSGREWQIRLYEEIKTNKNGRMVTFTFSNESYRELYNCSIWKKNRETGVKEMIAISSLKGYDIDNAIATIAMRRFNERYRKKYKKAIRHFMVTELGHQGTENIHLHGIVWSNVSNAEITELWKYGFTWIGNEKWDTVINYVDESTVNYITKYISKMDFEHKCYTPKILTSASMGKGYIDNINEHRFKEANTIQTYKSETGHEIALPTYYRKKLWSDDEREALWLHMLDKKERYVCGERIDISDNDENYYKALNYHRKRVISLGYLDNSKAWEREQYEEERRELLQSKRLG